MMMNSFRRNDTKRRLSAATALVAVLFLADVLSGGKIRAEVRAGGAALSAWGASASRALFGNGFFSSRAALSAKNRSLEGELAQYKERTAAYEVLREENARLADIAHLAESSPGTTAPIVSSTRSSPYGTFLIGAGEADGIVRGDIVLTPGGFVLGTVTDMGRHTAVVSEALAPGASVEGIVGGSSLLFEGKGAGSGRGSAPRGLRVAVGDAVVAPSYGGRALGEVGEVASSTSSGREDVYIRIPVNPAALQFVYVVAR